MKAPTEEQIAVYEKWLEERPEKIREVAKRLPPWVCYTSTENPGHYRVYSLSESEKDGEVTVTIIHGRDSYLPGVAAFGISPDTLVRCGCGKWEQPTQDQIAETRHSLEQQREEYLKKN